MKRVIALTLAFAWHLAAPAAEVPPAPVHTQAELNAAVMVVGAIGSDAALPMRIPFDAREWQAIDVTGVPAFYLLQDGKVIARHRGWAGEEGKAALLRLLDAAGR